MQKRPTYKYQRIRDIREDKDLTQKSIADFVESTLCIKRQNKGGLVYEYRSY